MGQFAAPSLLLFELFLLLLVHPLVILSWFVEGEVAKAALAGHIIQEDEVETRPDQISTSCIDEAICLDVCRKYFSLDAWLIVKDVVKEIEQNPTWHCGRCTLQIEDETQSSIMCSSCLTWFHFTCLCLKQFPKSKFWFCRTCFVT